VHTLDEQAASLGLEVVLPAPSPRAPRHVIGPTRRTAQVSRWAATAAAADFNFHPPRIEVTGTDPLEDYVDPPSTSPPQVTAAAVAHLVPPAPTAMVPTGRIRYFRRHRVPQQHLAAPPQPAAGPIPARVPTPMTHTLTSAATSRPSRAPTEPITATPLPPPTLDATVPPPVHATVPPRRFAFKRRRTGEEQQVQPALPVGTRTTNFGTEADLELARSGHPPGDGPRPGRTDSVWPSTGSASLAWLVTP
jgi:hypothetical protein